MFGPALSPSQTNYPVHLLLVALDRRDVVSQDQESGVFQLALRRALKRALRFRDTVREKIAHRKTCIRHRKIGIRRDCFLRCCDRYWKSAGSVRGYAPE